jgi:hypothetical protein
LEEAEPVVDQVAEYRQTGIAFFNEKKAETGHFVLGEGYRHRPIL